MKLNGSRTELIPNVLTYNNLILILLLKNSSEIFSHGVVLVSSVSAQDSHGELSVFLPYHLASVH